MEILIKKGRSKNILFCRRKDKTTTSENLNLNTPFHDIAHFVIEKEFEMEDGFYGKIRQGLSIQELSHTETIQMLGKQIWLSEIMTRNLQSINSGAAKDTDFEQLVEWEVKSIKEIGSIEIPKMESKQIEKMIALYSSLCEQWNELLENQELKLEF